MYNGAGVMTMSREFVFTNIRLPEDLHRQLKTWAAREWISLAEIMRRAGKHYLLTLEGQQGEGQEGGRAAEKLSLSEEIVRSREKERQ